MTCDKCGSKTLELKRMSGTTNNFGDGTKERECNVSWTCRGCYHDGQKMFADYDKDKTDGIFDRDKQILDSDNEKW